MKGSFLHEVIANLKLRPLRQNHGSPEELKALARSWLKRAIHPIVTRLDRTVADGHRRIEGLKLLGETQVNVFVTDENLSDNELTEIGLISALHRADLAPYDQAVACRDWKVANEGATWAELALKIDRDPSMITKLNSLWNSIPEVIAAAEEGKIGPQAWHQISLLPRDDAFGLLNMHLAGLPAGQIAELSRKMRKPAPVALTSSVKLSRVKCPLSTGTTIVVTGAEMDLSGLIEALSSALEAARKANKDGLDVKTLARVMADRAKAGAA